MSHKRLPVLGALAPNDRTRCCTACLAQGRRIAQPNHIQTGNRAHCTTQRHCGCNTRWTEGGGDTNTHHPPVYAHNVELFIRANPGNTSQCSAGRKLSSTLTHLLPVYSVCLCDSGLTTLSCPIGPHISLPPLLHLCHCNSSRPMGEHVRFHSQMGRPMERFA